VKLLQSNLICERQPNKRIAADSRGISFIVEVNLLPLNAIVRLTKFRVVAVVLSDLLGVRSQVVLMSSVRRYLIVIGGAIADNKHEQLV
jgi:hypothetical protein